MITLYRTIRADRFSDRKTGHLDQSAAQIISRNTTRGIEMKFISLTQGKFAIENEGGGDTSAEDASCHNE